MRECAGPVFTWRDRLLEDSDELHSVHRLRCLALSALGSFGCRAAHSGLFFFHGSQAVSATGRDQSAGDEAEVPRCRCGVFHSDVAETLTAVAQSHVSSFTPPVRILLSGGKAARDSPAEGYHALTAGPRAAFRDCPIFEQSAVNAENPASSRQHVFKV